jgi:putative ABC transport system ATP-binding protein
MSSDPQVAVRMRGVTKQFWQGEAKVLALRGVDLDVLTNELLIVAGPSGCGKTTAISMIAAILKHDAGSIEVFGRDLAAIPEGELAAFRRVTVGFVFQQFNLLPALTVEENASIPLLLAGARREAAVAKARAVLERVGMGAKAKALPRELSGGQQQRVAIARALVHEPRLIVCDEPTSALDARSGRQVMELLRESAAGPGRALVVVTHDARAFGFADRIAHMHDGRVVEVTTSTSEHPSRAALAAAHTGGVA